MVAFCVQVDGLLLGLVAALALVLSALYAAALSTARGREVCERRTYWTVVGGHLLMALTMSFVSVEVAGLWLLWSAVCGTPLVVRSLAQEWRQEKLLERLGEAAVRGVMRAAGPLVTAGEEEVADAPGGGSGVGDGYGEGGAGV